MGSSTHLPDKRHTNVAIPLNFIATPSKRKTHQAMYRAHLLPGLVRVRELLPSLADTLARGCESFCSGIYAHTYLIQDVPTWKSPCPLTTRDTPCYVTVRTCCREPVSSCLALLTP